MCNCTHPCFLFSIAHADEDEEDDAETLEADRIMIKHFSESTSK